MAGQSKVQNFSRIKINSRITVTDETNTWLRCSNDQKLVFIIIDIGSPRLNRAVFTVKNIWFDKKVTFPRDPRDQVQISVHSQTTFDVQIFVTDQSTRDSKLIKSRNIFPKIHSVGAISILKIIFDQKP